MKQNYLINEFIPLVAGNKEHKHTHKEPLAIVNITKQQSFKDKLKYCMMMLLPLWLVSKGRKMPKHNKIV